MADRKWDSVIQSEIDRSLRKIRANANPDLVLEEFANRVTNKLLHPILTELNKTEEIDLQSSKLEYEENYLRKYGIIADHMNDVE